MLQLLNEVKGETITHLVDLIKKGVHHVVLNLEFVEFLPVFAVLGHEVGNFVMENIGDCFSAPSA
jgi:hypothetical protein